MLFAGRMSATILVTSISNWKRYRNKQELINAVFEYYCEGIEDDTLDIMEASTYEPIALYRVRPWGLRPSKGFVFDR
jgi:hypothetical protein